MGHGGVVLHSGDGGASWVRQLDGEQAASIELAAATAWAGESAQSDAARRRLRDATRAASEGPDKPLLDVAFRSPMEGFVVGAYGAIFATKDAGKTWVSRREALDNPKNKHLYKLTIDGDTIWIAGEQGTLFRSTDRGASFTSVKTPYAGTFFGVVTARDGSVFAFGLRGNVFRSRDGTSNWEKVDLERPITITAAARMPDGAVVFVDESGRALRSPVDGGRLATVQVAQPFAFTGLVVASDGSLVLAGVRGTTRIPSSSITAPKQP